LSDEVQLTKLVLSRKEAANYLGISINTLDLHKEIPRLRIGVRTLFRIETLNQYLANMEKACRK
jgi:hypothetical protein